MKKIITLGLFMVTAAAIAQSWLGNYQWSATDAEKVTVEKAVEDGAQQVGFLVRSIARGRLKETTKPFQKLSFAMSDQTLTMVRDDDTPITGTTDGSKIEWKRKDGKTFTVQQTLAENVLTQTFTDPEGNTRVNKHTFNETAQTMSLDITINSSSLKTPLKYTLTYTKPEGSEK